jgi:RHS repeat-associated protein
MMNESGTGTTIYGFDGEQYDSYINLLNLRARQLNTETGRFLTKDTWEGDYARPITLNKWGFAEENPVKYTDPTGHLPTMCQSMPTNALYESCIYYSYNIGPAEYSKIGNYTDGDQGCYVLSENFIYRSRGYLEGIQYYGNYLYPQVLAGNETVYDFATMQRRDYSFVGTLLDLAFFGGGANAYFGEVTGFSSERNIDQYKGATISGTFGLSWNGTRKVDTINVLKIAQIRKG